MALSRRVGTLKSGQELEDLRETKLQKFRHKLARLVFSPLTQYIDSRSSTLPGESRMPHSLSFSDLISASDSFFALFMCQERGKNGH